MKKKVLSIVLAIVMVLGMVPFAGLSVFAEDSIPADLQNTTWFTEAIVNDVCKKLLLEIGTDSVTASFNNEEFAVPFDSVYVEENGLFFEDDNEDYYHYVYIGLDENDVPEYLDGEFGSDDYYYWMWNESNIFIRKKDVPSKFQNTAWKGTLTYKDASTADIKFEICTDSVVVTVGDTTCPKMYCNVSEDDSLGFVSLDNSAAFGFEFEGTAIGKVTFRLLDDSATAEGVTAAALHEHNFGTTWTIDAAGHWHNCTEPGCTIDDYATCGFEDAAYSAHTGLENNICDICGRVFYRAYDLSYTNSTIEFKMNVLNPSVDPLGNREECVRFDAFLIAGNSGKEMELKYDEEKGSGNLFDYDSGCNIGIHDMGGDVSEAADKPAYCYREGYGVFHIVINAANLENVRDFSSQNPYVWLALRPCDSGDSMDDDNPDWLGFYGSTVCLGKFDSYDDLHNVKPSSTLPKPNNTASVTLSDAIVTNFKLDLPAYAEIEDVDVSELTVKATYNTNSNVNYADGKKTLDVTDKLFVGEDGRYVLNIPQAPAQIAEKITVEIYNGEKLLETIDCCGKIYADKIMAKTAQEMDIDDTALAKFKAVCVAMVNYGDCAQKYFKCGKAVLTEADGDKYNCDLPNEVKGAKFSVSGSDIKVKSLSFMSLANSALRIYFEGDITAEDVSCSDGKKTVTVNTEKKYIEVGGFVAAELDEVFTVTVKNTTIEANALAYAYLGIGSANAVLSNLCKSIALYNTAANAAFSE